jgi:hypothetical protein
MSFASFLQWLHDTGFSVTLRESIWAEPLVETIHVLTLTVFLGFTVLLDLRLMGVAMRRRRASEVIGQLNPWVMGSFAAMLVTGVLLFSGDPVAFYASIFFRIKMLMLVLALMNILVFNLTAGRKIAEWDTDSRTPGRAKLAAIVSLVLWAAIIAAGRAIAYSLPPP